MQDAREIKARDDKSPEVGDEGHVGGEVVGLGVRAARCGKGGGGRREGARRGGRERGRALEGEMDVEEGGDGLDRAGVLCVIEEVSLAGLVFGVPFKYVELGVVSTLRGRGFGWGVGEGG